MVYEIHQKLNNNLLYLFFNNINFLINYMKEKQLNFFLFILLFQQPFFHEKFKYMNLFVK